MAVGGVLADWQSAFHAPVSQPRPILPMQPGARVDAVVRVGVKAGMAVDVGVAIGVDSIAVTGVFVAVGVWVGAGVAAEPPSIESSRAISLSMRARSESISLPCVWICSCC